MVVEQEILTRTIYCNCGGFLEEGAYPLGHRVRRRLRRCTRCHRERRPSWPVLFVDERGRYVVELHACRVSLDRLGQLEWPEEGWR